MTRSFVCSGKTLPGCRLAVDNIYSDSQFLRGHVTLSVSKQDSCSTDDGGISLNTADNRRMSLDRKSSYISRITDHTRFSWISWIDLEQPISDRDVGVQEDKSPRDDITELKASDECLHHSLGEQVSMEVDNSTSHCGKVTSQMGSGTSSFAKLLTLLSSEEEDDMSDNVRKLKSETCCDADVVALQVCYRQRERTDIADSGYDGDWLAEDNDTQLKQLQLDVTATNT